MERTIFEQTETIVEPGMHAGWVALPGDVRRDIVKYESSITSASRDVLVQEQKVEQIKVESATKVRLAEIEAEKYGDPLVMKSVDFDHQLQRYRIEQRTLRFLICSGLITVIGLPLLYLLF